MQRRFVLSLNEILVIIAVLAILSAILFPILARPTEDIQLSM